LCKQQVSLRFRRVRKISSLSAYWNLKCRSVFKRHETDQAFQKDAEQSDDLQSKRGQLTYAPNINRRVKGDYSDRLALPRRLEELIRKRATLSLLSILKTARPLPSEAHGHIGPSSKWLQEWQRC
jgi:hypothetical protein